jgi:hypothetical protein
MILGGYPSGIKGGKKQLKLCPSFMLSKALGKALNHKLYQYWAYAQLHLTRALIAVKPEVSCFTYIYLPGNNKIIRFLLGSNRWLTIWRIFIFIFIYF